MDHLPKRLYVRIIAQPSIQPYKILFHLPTWKGTSKAQAHTLLWLHACMHECSIKIKWSQVEAWWRETQFITQKWRVHSCDNSHGAFQGNHTKGRERVESLGNSCEGLSRGQDDGLPCVLLRAWPHFWRVCLNFGKYIVDVNCGFWICFDFGTDKELCWTCLGKVYIFFFILYVPFFIYFKDVGWHWIQDVFIFPLNFKTYIKISLVLKRHK